MKQGGNDFLVSPGFYCVTYGSSGAIALITQVTYLAIVPDRLHTNGSILDELYRDCAQRQKHHADVDLHGDRHGPRLEF